MQISRHWRMNAQRYRLEGYRNSDGTVSLQPRPEIRTEKPEEEKNDENKVDPRRKRVPV